MQLNPELLSSFYHQNMLQKPSAICIIKCFKCYKLTNISWIKIQLYSKLAIKTLHSKATIIFDFVGHQFLSLTGLGEQSVFQSNYGFEQFLFLHVFLTPYIHSSTSFGTAHSHALTHIHTLPSDTHTPSCHWLWNYAQTLDGHLYFSNQFKLPSVFSCMVLPLQGNSYSK